MIDNLSDERGWINPLNCLLEESPQVEEGQQKGKKVLRNPKQCRKLELLHIIKVRELVRISDRLDKFREYGLGENFLYP